MIEKMPKTKVFHGSPVEFDSHEAVPKRQARYGKKDGETFVKFDEESFHATPHRWIALAYTFAAKDINNHDKKLSYTMGVNLYDNEHRVVVCGVGSLEESLGAMYEDGGYLYHFDGDKFIHKKGLGSMEVIVNDPIEPVHSEFVANPVQEMKDLGVRFEFIDLTK